MYGWTNRMTVNRCVLAALVLATVIGCGESQDDMMKRAASRTRDPGPDDTPPVAAAAPAASAVVPAANAPASTNPAAAAVSAAPATAPIETKPALKAISERKPEQPLSDIDRRKRALSNIEKVSAAILARYKQVGTMPVAWMESSGGIKTLSWRVAILPYLGYGDLYNQFSVEEPWDGPNNKKLLDMIPDEFVSPERFDTNTNYLLPVYGAYIGAYQYDSPSGFRFSGDTDAAVNTLMLLEVNDSYAVPWTQPADYGEGLQNVKRGLGSLREDGTFAVWANGLPVLLSNVVGAAEIHNALSAGSGDGQRAGLIHRSITIAEVTDQSVVADTAAEVVPGMQSPLAEVVPEAIVVRDPVPDQIAQAAAGKRLREVFAKKLAEAYDDDKRAQLANELLAASANMSDDGSSAYVMQGASIKLASQAGKIDLVLRGIDTRVGRFDVDAYETNMTALADFGVDNANREAAGVDGAIFLRRTLPAIFAAIRDDEYVRASALARDAYKFSDQPRNAPIPKALNLLRVQLSSAQRNFDAAKDSLAEYRLDSSNGEAASTFGRFLVFIKGDWDTGLPLLAKGGGEDMRELALADIKGAEKAMEMVALGDAWWSMAERAKAGVYRQACADRASHWYAKAFVNLPDSLDKLHVKGRLDEAGDAGKASPLAIVRDLAEKINVDLRISLASIAAVGERQQSQVANDE